MKSLRPLALSLILAVSVSILSCRDRGGDGDSPDGGELTAEQQAAVESVIEQLTATSKAITSLTSSFDGVDSVSDLVAGECPIVTAELDSGDIAVTLEFPDGCTNDYYGDSAVSGSVSVAFNIALRTFNATFEGFTVDDQTFDGTLALELTREDGTRTLSGDVDLTATGVGSVQGTMTVQFDPNLATLDFTITMVEADLTLTDEDGQSYSVSAEGLVIEPIDNGNFVPEAGTVSFEVPSDDPFAGPVTVTIAFDDESPLDGTVAVKVGDNPPVEYHIPGVG